jgi:hypothetical protein
MRGWQVGRPTLREIAFPSDEDPLVYICGPTRFVETAATGLVELGHEPRDDQDGTLLGP